MLPTSFPYYKSTRGNDYVGQSYHSLTSSEMMPQSVVCETLSSLMIILYMYQSCVILFDFMVHQEIGVIILWWIAMIYINPYKFNHHIINIFFIWHQGFDLSPLRKFILIICLNSKSFIRYFYHANKILTNRIHLQWQLNRSKV